MVRLFTILQNAYKRILKTGDLPTAGALSGAEFVPVIQNDILKKAVASDLGGGGLPYQVYTALLTQSGTDAPVATVLQNTLGGTVVWARSDTGVYTATLADAFTAGKTCATIGENNSSESDFWINVITYTSESVVTIATSLGDAPGANGGLNSTFVEIKVYP